MDASVLVAIISGAASVAAVVVSNGATRAAMSQKVDDLSDRVDKHNKVIERVYELEACQAANNERFKTLFNEVNSIRKEDSNG